MSDIIRSDMELMVGDLVTRVADEEEDLCIVTVAERQYCSYCATPTGPFHYSVYPMKHSGKHAWHDRKDLNFVRRHEELVW